VGTRTDSAREAVVAARADFDDQVDRLEAAGRAAVDVPAKVRAHPARSAGVAAGGAFLAVGGPKRILRRAKRAVTGEELRRAAPKDIGRQEARHRRAEGAGPGAGLREVHRRPPEGAATGGCRGCTVTGLATTALGAGDRGESRASAGGNAPAAGCPRGGPHAGRVADGPLVSPRGEHGGGRAPASGLSRSIQPSHGPPGGQPFRGRPGATR
jgi:hypothetical protein